MREEMDKINAKMRNVATVESHDDDGKIKLISIRLYDIALMWHRLLCKVELPEEQSMSFFITGLQSDIELAVRMFKPKSLAELYGLCKLQESQLNVTKQRGKIPLLATPRRVVKNRRSIVPFYGTKAKSKSFLPMQLYVESDDDDEPAERDDDMETTYDEEQLINQQNVAHVPPPVLGEENIEIDSLMEKPCSNSISIDNLLFDFDVDYAFENLVFDCQCEDMCEDELLIFDPFDQIIVNPLFEIDYGVLVDLLLKEVLPTFAFEDQAHRLSWIKDLSSFIDLANDLKASSITHYS
ncbi:hypothetical protein Tco_0565258 [Tanacetum coccineum]